MTSNKLLDFMIEKQIGGHKVDFDKYEFVYGDRIFSFQMTGERLYNPSIKRINKRDSNHDINTCEWVIFVMQ